MSVHERAEQIANLLKEFIKEFASFETEYNIMRENAKIDPPIREPRWLTISKAAKYLNVSETHLHNVRRKAPGLFKSVHGRLYVNVVEWFNQ